VPTKLDIYIFTIIAGLIFLLVDYLLVPEFMVHPEVSLTHWHGLLEIFINEIYNS
jgi:hypothetical protein